MFDKPKHKPPPHLLSWRAAVLWLCPFVWLVALGMMMHYVPVLLALLVSTALMWLMLWDNPVNDLTVISSVIWLSGLGIMVATNSLLLALAYLIPPLIWLVAYLLYRWTRFVWRLTHA